MENLIGNIWLIPIYPLIAFFAIVLGRWANLIQPKRGKSLVIGATALGLIHTLAFLAQWGKMNYLPVEQNFSWLHAGQITLPMGYYLDATGMMMLLVVTSVSLLIQIYTHGYMHDDQGYSRFYAYLALFNFSMLSLVLSSNLFQIYVFWEMVGVSSYLLIGFWFERPAAAAAALKAFLMNRIGDFGLLIGILMLLLFTWQYWADSPILTFSHMTGAAQVALQNAGPVAFTIMAILIFMGPMAKSAQVPLHTWLPDAMEGPTPISALIHAATMVAAGVFLIARMYPVFTLSQTAMMVIATVGVVTAVVAATIAVTQVDIKKALAYSTMSQLGYMVMAMGLGAYTAGLFHLMTHAFFKAMLFLCSGAVIYGCHHEQDMRQMGGLAKSMPKTAITYLIGTIAITGVLPFAGFWSKDEIIASALPMPVFFTLALITAGLTSFYMFRTYFMTFVGEYRGHEHPHEAPGVMTWPLIILAVPSVVIGFLLSGQFGLPSFGGFVHYGEHAHHEPMNMAVVGASVGIALIGLLVAWLIYGKRQISTDNLKKSFKPVYDLLWNKWYFDTFYLGFVKKMYLPFAWLSAWFDKNVIDGMVGLSAVTVNAGGNMLRAIQNGRVQSYLIVFFFAVIFLTLILFKFI